MDNEKLIAQISSSEDSWVDRVSLRRSNNSSLSSRMGNADELRKKTIRMEGMARSRLTKLRLQDNFEKLKNHLNFEYGDNLILNLKSSEIMIYSRWLDGSTLKDLHTKEEPLKHEDIQRIKNKLKLWVRIFEHLSFFHTNGIIHGNIKPENILIRDRSNVDLKATYNSEFFDKKAEIPHVALLDGGYYNFIEFHEGSVDYDLASAKISTEKKIWLSPEAHGFLEGSFKESSDIFSLAAVMAWDFGLIEINKHSIVNSLWSLYMPLEPNTFRLGNKIYKWSSRNSLSDMMKRLRTVLLRALEPVQEKRTINARDIAFELMLMTNRLVDVLDVSPSEILDIKPVETSNNSLQKEVLLKSFEIPEKVLPFLLHEESPQNTRLWIEARNKSANKHAIMRSLNSGLNVIGHNCFYFGVKTSQSKIPFLNLDLFCNGLLSYILHINPQFIEEIRAIFNDMGAQIESIFFVLPSLKTYAQKNASKHVSQVNNIIQVQNEIIQKNIEYLLVRIISASKLQFIIIDDINRSDYSSISIILKLFSNLNLKTKWIIGIRLDEDIDSELTRKELFQLKHKDLTFASIKENRTITYWITKLNTLSKNDAKMLSIFSIIPNAIDIDTFEILSNKFISPLGGVINDQGNLPEKESDAIVEDDLIPADDIPSPAKTGFNPDNADEKQNKDSLSTASDVLKRAIQLGLIRENRDTSTGYLVSYYWEHLFVLQCFSMILSPNIRNDVYNSLLGIYHANIKESESLEQIIHIADCLIKSKTNQSHSRAYSTLLVAAEKLCDMYTAEYIIKKFQILEEQVEIDRPKEASILIPKIREKIADISRSINKNELAVKYYDAVSWNIFNHKKRALLLLKSFFPSQIKNRDLRTKEYYRILNICERKGLYPGLTNVKDYDASDEIINIINKIQRKLAEENSYIEALEHQSYNEIIKNELTNLEKIIEEKPDEIVSKSSRDKVLSYFFRSCLGWIDNIHIYPYAVRALHFTAETNDGESIIQMLFTLLISCERNISIKIRSAMLETISDLAGRLNQGFTVYEVLLYKAWCALFYDGNLSECKKSLERLNSSFNELPYTIRQCSKKIQILYEFENLTPQMTENKKDLSEKYFRKFKEYELADWNIGYDILHIKSMPTSLKVVPGDSLFVGNILNEKTDQILLYSHYLIEDGHVNASHLVSNEAKNTNIRQWFNDTSSQLEYVPEKMALKYIDLTILKNMESNQGDKLKYHKLKNNLLSAKIEQKNIPFQKQIKKLKTYFQFARLKPGDVKPESIYWGDDKAILFSIKFDLAKTQDTEKLHFLAQSVVKSGFIWSGYRIAHKARCGLTTILNEIREVESIKTEASPTASMILTPTESKSPEEIGSIRYENSSAYPEQGVALNYVLEFIHNFQHHLQDSHFTYEEIKAISDFIRISIPKDTDIIESTLSGALKASVKRLQLQTDHMDDNSELTHDDSTVISLENPQVNPPQENDEASENIQLPKAG